MGHERYSVFFSPLKPREQISPDFTSRISTICLNGSASLNKMAAMPIYDKNT